jgi:hypothetical protein
VHFFTYTSIRSQQDIKAFAINITKPTPVTKAGLKEFLLEMIVDADLVSSSYILF